MRVIDRIRTFLECHPKRAAFLAGLTAAVSMPPFGFFPGLWIAYPTLLIIALTRKNVLSAIGAGWLFGFGFFLASLYWITNALLVEADNWWWAVPFAVVVLPATLALYPAVAAGLFRVLLPTGLRAVALFVVLFMLTEWARGHFFTGFPWNTPALAFAGCPFVPQSLAWFGNWGLSLLTVLAAATPAAIMLTSGRRALTCMTAGVLIVVALAVAGALRLPQTSADSHPDIRLRLVQPGIPQAEKWDNDKANSNFHKILRLSTRIGPEPVTHLIWPESAFTWIVKGKTPNLGAIGTVTPAGGVTLTGIVRHENGHYYNSIAAINEKGQMVAKYDKSHLVPFGEYFPLQNLLNLPSLTGGTTGYTEGPGPVVIDLPSLPPFAPLICYEIIFPGEVIPDTGTRPSWLLNATNDAWYGQSIGPYQHLAQARFRAIEEGLPVIRVANTGISAVFDGWGRVIGKLRLGESGVFDSPLPKPVPDGVWNKTCKNMLFCGLLTILALFSYLPSSQKIQNVLH